MRPNTARKRLWSGVGVASLAAVVASTAFGAPASRTTTTLVDRAAANINPKFLVLSGADVPAGYQLGEAVVVSNRTAADADLAQKLGRITGYAASYVRQDSLLGSAAESFRTSHGAHLYLGSYLTKLRGSTCAAGLYENWSRVRPVSVGNEGWIYRHQDCGPKGPTGRSYYMVVWRHDRILAWIASWRKVNTVGAEGLSIARTVALAKLQQRRIVAALRP